MLSHYCSTLCSAQSVWHFNNRRTNWVVNILSLFHQNGWRCVGFGFAEWCESNWFRRCLPAWIIRIFTDVLYQRMEIPLRISIISKNANQTWYSLQEKHCCSLSEACVLCQCFDPFYTSNFLISKLQHLSIESLLLRLLWYIPCMRDLTRVFCSIFVLLFIQYGWEAITRFLPSNLAVASWHFVEHRFFWLVVNNSIVVFSIFNNNKTPCLHINMW